MYGTYKASSTGAMNLELDAFKGDNFPEQIRSRTHKLSIRSQKSDDALLYASICLDLP